MIEPGLLSIIVPARNEERELPATLAALRVAAEGLDVPAEVIVVDDASTDATAAVARAHGARVVPVAIHQIAGVRNAGAAAARGEWLVFVDADTRVTPEVMRGAVAAMRDGAVGGGCQVRFEPPVPLWVRLFLPVILFIWRFVRSAAGCFVFARRADFDAVGGFDERYYASEEVWLSRALRARGRFIILPQAVATSGRKARMHSARVLLGSSARILLSGQGALQRREGLDIWYDGRREGGDDRGGTSP